ncbi:glycosyltransferase family 2 protein [Mycobacterium sp. MS1601]|uniref:glycosyltransferase family 2 protein n=1 Tax=Mycobacterium sp. MS1601 TaxID=1936029 RepID=UPI001F3B3FED|nr:glycosyltransferase [Mycobacterium sp. MS1601]
MIDLDDLPESATTVTITPQHAEGYLRARLLLRSGGSPVTFIDADIVDGTVTVEVPGDRAAAAAAVPHPPISVVLCTRDRPEHLARALASLQALDYADFEVVVVDNAPATDATEQVVAATADPRIRRVLESTPGLSNARNTGLRTATHEIVAFTDDDVVVDPHWLQGIARGFARGGDVSCVCGMVPSGELRTAAQGYFDQRVPWADTIETRVYSASNPPEDMPLFPFQVGKCGTGANFAVRRSRMVELGGFDEALGVGTKTCGGEDLDLFFRVLASGDTLVNEPSAIVWHRHRSDSAALLTQARGYGLGLGAWLTKVFLHREHRKLALGVVRRRFRSVVARSADYGAIAAQARDFGDEIPKDVGRQEVFAVLGGPLALWQGRRQGRRATPLLER